jgi:alkylhydroperoxidase family enzyme
MLDPLTTAEIQALRLKLQLFASRQSDATVRSQCLAVDTKLAEALEGDDPILRQVLANSVEQLEEALRWAACSTIEKATMHFLTGLRRRGSLSA